MLPYHIIHPQKRQQNDSQFLHYFSLGSYQTSFTHPTILAFSKITLTPKKHLPKITYDELKANCEASSSKLHKLIVPLYGNFTVDQKHIANLLENQPNQNNQNNNQQHFVLKECNFAHDFQYIANKEEKDKNAICLFILYKTTQISQATTQSQQKHSDRFCQAIQQKSLNIFPIIQSVGDIELSLIQVLENTKLTLLANDLLYLEKGKVAILEQGQDKSVEIKNKGNKKGEQNYIENMLYAAEQMKVSVQKGSIFLIGSTSKNATADE